MDFEVVVVIGFNEVINVYDVILFGVLMYDEYCFVDFVGLMIEGRMVCFEVWCGFFEVYFDYVNVFEDVIGYFGEVVIWGYLVLLMFEFDGFVLWLVVVDGGLVVEWWVYEDILVN